jgi:hypothetical protein
MQDQRIAQAHAGSPIGHLREVRQVDCGPFDNARIAVMRQRAKPRRIEELRSKTFRHAQPAA